MKPSLPLLFLCVASTLATPSRVPLQPDKVRRQAGNPSPTTNSCVYYPQLQARPVTICGNKGTLERPAELGVAKTQYSLELCAKYCYSQAACRSFYFTPKYPQETNSPGSCQLFREPIESMQLKHATHNKAMYYDRSCFAKVCGCGNEGAQYAFFNSSAPQANASYPAFDPTVFKTDTPYFNGTTDVIEGDFTSTDGDVNIYADSPPSLEMYFAVNHRGYLFATVTGNYTIYLGDVDDIGLLWVGPNAYSGYTRENANLEIDLDQDSVSYTFEMTAGSYIPVRYIYGQFSGDAYWAVYIIDPNGDDAALDGQYTPTFVAYSCDMTTAPPYPDFGSET